MGQNRIVKVVFGALLLIIGLGAAAFTLANLAKDLSLWIFGRKTTGYVTDQIAECTGAEEGEGEMTCEYFIQYEFPHVLRRSDHPHHRRRSAGVDRPGRCRAEQPRRGHLLSPLPAAQSPG